jgi:hypothetical protein
MAVGQCGNGAGATGVGMVEQRALPVGKQTARSSIAIGRESQCRRGQPCSARTAGNRAPAGGPPASAVALVARQAGCTLRSTLRPAPSSHGYRSLGETGDSWHADDREALCGRSRPIRAGGLARAGGSSALCVQSRAASSTLRTTCTPSARTPTSCVIGFRTQERLARGILTS